MAKPSKLIINHLRRDHPNIQYLASDSELIPGCSVESALPFSNLHLLQSFQAFSLPLNQRIVRINYNVTKI